MPTANNLKNSMPPLTNSIHALCEAEPTAVLDLALNAHQSQPSAFPPLGLSVIVINASDNSDERLRDLQKDRYSELDEKGQKVVGSTIGLAMPGSEWPDYKTYRLVNHGEGPDGQIVGELSGTGHSLGGNKRGILSAEAWAKTAFRPLLERGSHPIVLPHFMDEDSASEASDLISECRNLILAGCRKRKDYPTVSDLDKLRMADPELVSRVDELLKLFPTSYSFFVKTLLSGLLRVAVEIALAFAPTGLPAGFFRLRDALSSSILTGLIMGLRSLAFHGYGFGKKSEAPRIVTALASVTRYGKSVEGFHDRLGFGQYYNDLIINKIIDAGVLKYCEAGLDFCCPRSFLKTYARFGQASMTKELI